MCVAVFYGQDQEELLCIETPSTPLTSRWLSSHHLIVLFIFFFVHPLLTSWHFFRSHHPQPHSALLLFASLASAKIKLTTPHQQLQPHPHLRPWPLLRAPLLPQQPQAFHQPAWTGKEGTRMKEERRCRRTEKKWKYKEINNQFTFPFCEDDDLVKLPQPLALPLLQWHLPTPLLIRHSSHNKVNNNHNENDNAATSLLTFIPSYFAVADQELREILTEQNSPIPHDATWALIVHTWKIKSVTHVYNLVMHSYLQSLKHPLVCFKFLSLAHNLLHHAHPKVRFVFSHFVVSMYICMLTLRNVLGSWGDARTFAFVL